MVPYLLYFLVLLAAFSKDQPSTNNHKIARGLLPVVAADAKGVVLRSVIEAQKFTTTIGNQTPLRKAVGV